MLYDPPPERPSRLRVLIRVRALTPLRDCLAAGHAALRLVGVAPERPAAHVPWRCVLERLARSAERGSVFALSSAIWTLAGLRVVHALVVDRKPWVVDDSDAIASRFFFDSAAARPRFSGQIQMTSAVGRRSCAIAPAANKAIPNHTICLRHFLLCDGSAADDADRIKLPAVMLGTGVPVKRRSEARRRVCDQRRK